MSFAEKLMRAYFDFAYNQVYDFTTGKLQCYQELQRRCIGKLDFRDDDRLLCVGVGTGNEIISIVEMNRNVNIVGVDYSNTGLQKLRKKALKINKEIRTIVMDARRLEFPTGSFDKALCLHVVDFLEEHRQVTSEILRVLKDGGQFVITYPSEKEGAKLGTNILRDIYRHNTSSRNYVIGLLTFLAQAAMGAVYLPLILRRKRFYSRSELQTVFSQLTPTDFQIEEYLAYQDFIVYGRK